MRKILFACAVLISMPVVPAAGEPLVRMHTSYYYIDGPSATVLAAQLDQKSTTARPTTAAIRALRCSRFS